MFTFYQIKSLEVLVYIYIFVFINLYSKINTVVKQHWRSKKFIRISLTKALVLWWCDNKSDLIWFDLKK